jgi:hypothetical protein
VAVEAAATAEETRTAAVPPLTVGINIFLNQRARSDDLDGLLDFAAHFYCFMPLFFIGNSLAPLVLDSLEPFVPGIS